MESYYHPVTNRKARPRGAEHFNNFINLDQDYITESSFSQLPEGHTYYSAQHKLSMNEWMGTEGPACIYLVQDIEAAEDRAVRFMIGNSDGFKIWVNDVQVVESRDPWYWMPYNHGITIQLIKGMNRVVAKVVRTGRFSEFSLGYALPNTKVRWVNDLAAVLVKG